MAGTSLTFAGAGADLDACKRGVEQAVKGAEPLFFPDYFVCGQVAGDGGAGMTDGDPRARSGIHSNSHLVKAWPGSASPS
jgi:phosphoribosylaminoimidazole (AIR) synthetase